ncbi:MAG TPA: hydroxyacylglutathione hydrolase [Polyangiaceae bacterium]|nr:hydroxyacylglutathione hydrolase [Polyangiaceae bacterium]
MLVTVIPCLRDNYAYLLRAPGSREALIVDPSESEPVLREVAAQELRLVGILCTHHHLDHVGGNEKLLAQLGELPVYGHTSDRGRIPGQNQFLSDEQTFAAAGLTFQTLYIPGHTLGAVAYVGQGAVFTGDTLFAAGCGRLFEGTPEMMYQSLNVRLGALPDETKVYCGHEYTAANLKFAAHVEPVNVAVQEKARRVAELRDKGLPSMPSTIGEERATNPFMRCSAADVVAHAADRLGDDRSPQAVLAAIRAEKDDFRG